MYTKFIGDDGKWHEITTQQYEVGLYAIVDHDPAQQFGLDVDDKTFHQHLREQYEYDKDVSSPINN